MDLPAIISTASGKRTGQLTKILNNLNPNKDRGYSYDALGRLVQATGGPGASPLWTQTYSYDRYGNRTSVNSSGYSARGGTGVPPVDHAQDARATTARAQHIVTEPPASAGGSSLSRWERGRGEALASEPPSPDGPRRSLGAVDDDGVPERQSRSDRDSAHPAAESSLNSTKRSHHASPPQSGPPTFTDDPLNDPNNPESFKIKALHITELRTWINALRVRRGFANHVWQKPTASGGEINNTVFVSWEPIDEMRTALDQALGPPSGGYSAGLAQGQLILAIHIQELRDRVKNYWNVSVAIPRDRHASLAYNVTSNRITTAGFEYDAAGNQVRALIPSGTGSQRYRYDAANRLAQVRTDDNNAVIANSTTISGWLLKSQVGALIMWLKGCRLLASTPESGGSTIPTWSKSYVSAGSRLLATATPNGSGGLRCIL